MCFSLDIPWYQGTLIYNMLHEMMMYLHVHACTLRYICVWLKLMHALNITSNRFTLYIYTVNTSVDTLHQLHSDLLKRLDDSSDEVRIAISGTFVAYVRYIHVFTYTYVSAYASQVRQNLLYGPRTVLVHVYMHLYIYATLATLFAHHWWVYVCTSHITFGTYSQQGYSSCVCLSVCLSVPNSLVVGLFILQTTQLT